jgi:hypothetical protein
MKTKKFLYYFKFALFATFLLSFIYGFRGDVKNGGKHQGKTVYHLSKSTSGKVGDAFRMNVNNLNIPINSTGVIAEVDPSDGGNTNGYLGNHEFLFSGGFYLSGTKDGIPWANAVASASLEKDYVPGTVEGGETAETQLYVLDAINDEPFGQSWQDWKDAVALGADFYDGNNDGVYNPVDLNGNGKWDPDEDAPDQMGDVTAWCIYNDGVPAAQRYWTTSIPQGIEVKQTVFAFASSGAIGNLLFVRYRIKYVGLHPGDPETLDNVYFGVWADPDIGEVDGYNHNFVGCDTTRNAGYTYLKNPSPSDWGNQPPCFLIDFFSGPAAYIPGVTFIDNNGNGIYDPGDTPLDSAYSIRGQRLGIITYPGARNQPLSSFIEYINGEAVLRDPQNITEARNLMLGNSVTGESVDPCDWAYGSVEGGVPCADVDPRFWYSGDPVTGIGWLNTTEGDTRQMSNTGPFTLRKNEEKEIVVAYVVGQGANPLASVTAAKTIDDGAQFIFDNNFIAPSPPPPTNPTVTSGENFIDITWNTTPQFTFVDSTEAYNDHFEGYNIYAYKSNTTAITVNNISNRTLVARYTKSDFINDLYVENPNTGGIELLYAAPDSAHQLDPAVYSNSETGRIRLRITQDPFTGGRLVKGKPYYFSLTSYAPNYYALRYKANPDTTIGPTGDYYISSEAFVGISENIAQIMTVTLGEDEYSPPREIVSSNHVDGASSGNVGFDIINQDNLVGNEYEVTFFRDSSTTLYSTFWKLTDVTTNTLLLDSSKNFSYESSDVTGQVTDGFITRVAPDTAELGTPAYNPGANIWYKEFADASATGVYYVGEDAGFAKNVAGFPLKKSNVISVDKLRRVELRFGANQNGKAYRYINGYKGLPASNSYFYAEAIEPGDTVGKGQIGNWDLQTDRPKGFVDVPFTAWVADSSYGDEERQLAVGFVEKRKTAGNPNGNPDGIWNPTDSLRISGEEIIIFDSDYDPNGNQIQFTGGDFSTPGGTVTVWADMFKNIQNPPMVPPDAQGLTPEQIATFNSPWFNAMYVVGLEKMNPQTFYSNGDVLQIPIAVYPYTSKDVYRFKTLNQTSIDDNARRELFQKVNVFPNPLYGFNPATSYTNSPADNPFVTFSNLPRNVTITIYSLSGNKLRTLTTEDKSSPSSPFLRWDLQNESGVRVASGLYIAIVDSPKYGQKILKFSIIMPQKQLQKY